MSDSVQPHRRKPTRLPCPWDSPGKNTGVGCHFLLQCVKVKGKSLSRVRLLATPWTTAYQAPPSMGFSRQEYWSGVPLRHQQKTVATGCYGEQHQKDESVILYILTPDPTLSNIHVHKLSNNLTWWP